MQATFIIVREDLLVDPVTIVAEGILVGRLPTCELLLNHPSVSRLHAGITNAEGDYYIRNLRPGNPIMLNGEPLQERSEEHTSELQSHSDLVCRLLLEKKKERHGETLQAQQLSRPARPGAGEQQ